MRRSFPRLCVTGGLIPLALALLAAAQTGLSVQDVLRKNLEAAGGRAALARVKTLSFRTGGTRNVVSSSGEFKALTGRNPAVTEAILVAGGKVVRNSFGVVSEITGPQATVYETMAGLYAGLFSLAKFEGRLELVGVKSFGPEEFYHLSLTGPAGPVAVHFYLRADDFLLKRLVFLGATPDGDKYEINYDFAPFEEIEGLKLPLSWFDSRVGTRGNLTEMSEIKANVSLDKGFFTKAETNIGRVESSLGQMKGNVLDWDSSPYGLTIVTNWTRKDIDSAGLKTGDKLLVLIGEDQYRISFFARSDELPPWNDLPDVGPLLAPMQRGGQTFVIQAFGGAGGLSADKLMPLAAVAVKKIVD